MSFVFSLFFAGGLGLFSVIPGILASSLLSLFKDLSGNMMPTVIGLSWLLIPLNYAFSDGTIDVTIGIGGLIGYGCGFVYGITKNNAD